MSDFFEKPVLYMKDLVQLFDKHPITIRRWWKSGKFPVPIKHSILIWSAKDIEEWMNSTLNGNDHE